MMFLSLFPGLGYVFLSWMYGIPLRALVWYGLIVAVSFWGYRIYRNYLDKGFSQKQLKAWYRQLTLFYYAFFVLWLVIFLLFINKSEYQLHYIAIFTEIGAAVVASSLLMPDKKLFKHNIIMLMLPLVIYFILIGEWYSYLLSVFAAILTWVLIYTANSSHRLLMSTHYQANHDSLTGLFNRYYFIKYLQDFMTSLSVSKHHSYLLLIDLDHFKTINDSLGHDIGDFLLKEVSERIENSLSSHEFLARLGGDEFVIVGSEFNDKKQCYLEAEKLANQVLLALRESYLIDCHSLYISASIGVSMVSDDSTGASRFIKEADIAMYEAKERGRDGVIVFDNEMAERVALNLEIERLLHFALENNEVHMLYQPQLNKDKEVVGAEALARWTNSSLGEVTPDVFIPIAEHSGFIIELGRFIMETSFRTLSVWVQQGIDIKQFSINVSMRQFFYYDFVDDVRLLCKEYLTQEMREKVIFEVTESIIAEDVDKVVKIMEQIKALGIRFSMDDFGTGYSSLSSLKLLPINEIKIDRSFVAGLKEMATDQVMVSSILNMAREFDLTVVAEGVENLEQFDYLHSNHCDIYQGFCFSKPLTAEKFIEFYQKK